MRLSQFRLLNGGKRAISWCCLRICGTSHRVKVMDVKEWVRSLADPPFRDRQSDTAVMRTMAILEYRWIERNYLGRKKTFLSKTLAREITSNSLQQPVENSS